MDILETLVRVTMIETEMILLTVFQLRMWKHLARTQLANITSPGQLFSHLRYLKIGMFLMAKGWGCIWAKDSVPILLGLLMIFSTFSGCLGDDFLQSTDKREYLVA